MAIEKVNYDDKVDLQIWASIPNTNKIKAEDMNQIKNAINANADELDTTKNNLQSNDTKQDKLISKIKNALINTETEEAKSLYVEDASTIGSLEVLGNQEQETREGYNILDYLSDIRSSTNGLTINKDEETGYITVNGTPTSNYISIITGSSDITDLLEDGQTYTMWQENHSEGDLGGIYLQIIRSNKDDGGNAQYWTSSTDNYTFTVDKSLYKYAANIQTGPISQAGTFNNYRNRYMIYKGTDEKEFELYGASPSPNYPSKIVCLGSNKNEFNIENTRTLNNTVLDSVDENSIIFTNNGLGVNRQVFIECYLEKGTYTIQREFEILEGTGTESSGAVALYQANTWKQSLLTATDKTKTFTITESNTYRIRLGINDSNSMTENVKIKFYDIKIEKGTEATSYSPYGQGSTKISKINKNLFDGVNENYYINQQANSCGISEGDTGSIINVKGKKYITISSSIIQSRFRVGCINSKVSDNKSVTLYKGQNQDAKKNTTIDCEGYNYLVINATDLSSIQVEEGTTSTDYIEHEQTDYILYIQQEMLEGDYFVKEDDGWKEVHNYPKINSDNFNNITENTAYSGLFMLTVEDLYRNDIETSVFSDYYKAVIPGYMNSNLQTTEYNISAFTNNRIFITHNDFANNLSGLKNFLIDNNVSIFAKTTTPTKLPCTEKQSAVLEELNNLDLFNGVNNIITAEDISLLKLKYALDVETYVDNKLEEKLANINQQILEIVGGN